MNDLFETKKKKETQVIFNLRKANLQVSSYLNKNSKTKKNYVLISLKRGYNFNGRWVNKTIEFTAQQCLDLIEMMKVVEAETRAYTIRNPELFTTTLQQKQQVKADKQKAKLKEIEKKDKRWELLKL